MHGTKGWGDRFALQRPLQVSQGHKFVLVYLASIATSAVMLLGLMAISGIHVGLFGSSWHHLSNLYDRFRVSVGGYPSDAEFGGNNTGIAQAVVGAMEIPSTMTGSAHSAGIAGYARTRSTNHMAVGVHGFGSASAPGSQAEGGHFLTTNCIRQWCPAGSGVDASNIYITEHDINLMKVGDRAPRGNAFGIIMFGASETQPTGMFQGIRVDSPGAFVQPKALKWKESIALPDGTGETAILIGAEEIVGPAPSQPVVFRSRSSDGHERLSAVASNQDGAIELRPASGLVDVDGALRVHSDPPASSQAPCVAGEIRLDGTFIYVCAVANSWRRARLEDW